MAGECYLTQDHETIRSWARKRFGRPAAVPFTESALGPGSIRLTFPGAPAAADLEEISWEEWFARFDSNHLALLYQETTAAGGRSRFNRLIRSDTIGDTPSGAEWVGAHPAAPMAA